MLIHAWMLTGLLIGAPPSAPIDAAPAPRLEKGLEITWRGEFSEAILRPNVRAFRKYDVEARVYVLDVFERGADVALFTSIKLKPDLKAIPAPTPIVHLELVRVEPNGKMWLLPSDSLTVAPEKRLPLPLPLRSMEGLPIFESSVFVCFPNEKIRLGDAWIMPEMKRPAVNYRLQGFDSIRGTRCFKVVAAQQTEDWDKPKSETTAWRRTETISVSAKHGYAMHIERMIEKRDPQSGELGFRSKLNYEQVGHLRHPDRIGEDRRDEIAGAAQFNAEFEQAIVDPKRADAKPFEQILQRIEQHTVNHFSGDAVPYRQAILSVKRKVEAATRGHIPPAPPPPETSEPQPLLVGKLAPEIATVDLTTREPVALSSLRGRPVMLLYYQPASAKTAEPVMRLAQALFAQHGQTAFILPVAIGDYDKALQQRMDWELTVHILSGRNVHKQHGIDSTPCFVLIDERGLVKNVLLGWSEENVDAVWAEAGKWGK